MPIVTGAVKAIVECMLNNSKAVRAVPNERPRPGDHVVLRHDKDSPWHHGIFLGDDVVADTKMSTCTEFGYYDHLIYIIEYEECEKARARRRDVARSLAGICLQHGITGERLATFCSTGRLDDSPLDMDALIPKHSGNPKGLTRNNLMDGFVHSMCPSWLKTMYPKGNALENPEPGDVVVNVDGHYGVYMGRCDGVSVLVDEECIDKTYKDFCPKQNVRVLVYDETPEKAGMRRQRTLENARHLLLGRKRMCDNHHFIAQCLDMACIQEFFDDASVVITHPDRCPRTWKTA